MKQTTKNKLISTALGIGTLGIMGLGAYEMHFKEKAQEPRKEITLEQTRETQEHLAVESVSEHPYIDSLVEEEINKILSNKDLSAQIQSVFSQVSQYRDLIQTYSSTNNIDYHLAFANIAAESSGKNTAQSSKGAVGLTQLMPATARQQGLRVDRLVDERLDPAKCVEAGIHYLASKPGDFAYKLACYNAGEGKISRQAKRSGASTTDELIEHLYTETRNHVVKVLARKTILDKAIQGEIDFEYEQLPLWSQTHRTRTVRERETMYSIGQESSVPINRMKSANPQLRNPDLLKPGQNIYVPTP